MSQVKNYYCYGQKFWWHSFDSCRYFSYVLNVVNVNPEFNLNGEIISRNFPFDTSTLPWSCADFSPLFCRNFIREEWGGMLWGGGVLSCAIDNILQKFYTLFLTRFRTYKIASPPQTKEDSNIKRVTGYTVKKRISIFPPSPADQNPTPTIQQFSLFLPHSLTRWVSVSSRNSQLFPLPHFGLVSDPSHPQSPSLKYSSLLDILVQSSVPAINEPKRPLEKRLPVSRW